MNQSGLALATAFGSFQLLDPSKYSNGLRVVGKGSRKDQAVGKLYVTCQLYNLLCKNKNMPSSTWKELSKHLDLSN